MSRLTLEKETTKLEKYLKKQGRTDFIDEVRAASQEALDARLLGLAKHNQEIKTLMARDDKLIQAKDTFKELEAVHKDQIKMNDKLARFVALIMKEQELRT